MVTYCFWHGDPDAPKQILLSDTDRQLNTSFTAGNVGSQSRSLVCSVVINIFVNASDANDLRQQFASIELALQKK